MLSDPSQIEGTEKLADKWCGETKEPWRAETVTTVSQLS